MSYWIKNRLCWLAVCTIILIGGVSYLNKVQEMYPEKDRDVTLVEAFTYYGNNREEWRGWFLDKQYGTGFERTIRSKTYNDFVKGGSLPQEYTVTMSAREVDPKYNRFAEVATGMLMIMAFVMFCGKLIALLFGGRREFDFV